MVVCPCSSDQGRTTQWSFEMCTVWKLIYSNKEIYICAPVPVIREERSSERWEWIVLLTNSEFKKRVVYDLFSFVNFS